jgi:hypothetical protein
MGALVLLFLCPQSSHDCNEKGRNENQVEKGFRHSCMPDCAG